MSATLYGIDTGATMTVDLSNTTVDASLTDISELIVGGNVVIGLTKAQFTSILDISTNAGTGTAELKETEFKTLLASCIDLTDAGSTYELYTSGASLGGSTVETTFPTDNTVFYNFSDVISGFSSGISTDADVRTKEEVAWRVAGLSSRTELQSYDSAVNLIDALTNAGIVPDIAAVINAESFLLGTDISASDFIEDTNRFNFTAATAAEKERLFNSLADAGYIDAGDGLGTGVDVSFDDGFALAVPLTLKGGVQVNVSFASDISFVDASTNEVVDTADAENLRGELDGIAFSFAESVTSDAVTGSITGAEVLNNSGNPANDAIRFNLLLVAKNS
jgi:hypothetical protein